MKSGSGKWFNISRAHQPKFTVTFFRRRFWTENSGWKGLCLNRQTAYFLFVAPAIFFCSLPSHHQPCGDAEMRMRPDDDEGGLLSCWWPFVVVLVVDWLHNFLNLLNMLSTGHYRHAATTLKSAFSARSVAIRQQLPRLLKPGQHEHHEHLVRIIDHIKWMSILFCFTSWNSNQQNWVFRDMFF